jgi:hypothetical protein
MHTPEKRQLPRIPLGSVPRGAVALIHQGQRIEVPGLRDISHTGISFLLNQPVAVAAQVAIAYSDHHVKLEVFGRVAWCSLMQPTHSDVDVELDVEVTPQADAGHSGNYLLGVELLSPMMLYAVLPKA